MKKMSKLLRFVAPVFIILFWYYLSLPAINLKDRNFITFIGFSIAVCMLFTGLANVKNLLMRLGNVGYKLERDPVTGRPHFVKRSSYYTPTDKTPKILFAGCVAIAALFILSAIASLSGARIFNATRYRDLIEITSGDFAADVTEIHQSQIPVVDRDTASRLGNKKLGEMTDLVSQFEIQENYTQINYKGTAYRVTPLRYADPIKWFFNHNSGLPAYITVDMVEQDTDLVRFPEKGMMYSTSEYFFRNIYRHMRMHFPTKMFETVSFEIDDDGTPYWVAPTIRYRIGWWDGKDINGAVIVNALTGESHWYPKEQVPQWIDQLYDANLIMSQLDDNGLYQNGFLNSIFGQKGVRRTTYGYNYLAMDDDVWLYTGMSSVTSDESNIGFVLVNLRTKETKFYQVPGATELAAMDSARGQVQHLNYSATFPLLLNVSDRPAYFISLKDAAGLVKMYAFVDVAQYQIVGTGSTIEQARNSYRQALRLEDAAAPEVTESRELKGTIDAIASAVVGGNTTYYIKLKGSNKIYTAVISLNSELPFLKSGDEINITYINDEGACEILYFN